MGSWRSSQPRFWPGGWAMLISLVLPAGCRTPPLPAVDLAAPGWSILQGQAVWRPARSAPDIVGELVCALHADGRTWLEFAKPSVSLVVAQSTPDAWSFQSSLGRKSWQGRGRPPQRSAWLVLGRCLQGYPAPTGWTFVANSEHGWQLEASGTGERLEGVWDP